MEQVKQELIIDNSKTQSEQVLENELIAQLGSLGYSRIVINNETELLANLRVQLSKNNCSADRLNGAMLTDTEFKKVLNHLNSGSVYDRAMILRDKFQLVLDNGRSVYLEFFDSVNWCKNEYQVSNQITMSGSYKNRYDVTLLINGIPMVQIELKRRSLELKEAFNQINRYHKHSYWAGSGLYNYIQIFVISNGVNTKYYANNKNQSFKQTFYWADKENNIITQLKEFADEFLEKCFVSKMIAKYIVLNNNYKSLMILRPYQYYAVEAIVDKIRLTNDNGYIWHTTGSGKTLTSFKASQILSKTPGIAKIVFVVDRRDLDYQTTKEFNSFSEGSIDGTTNTNSLVKQFEDSNTKLIVTTIQKLYTAITKDRHLAKMDNLKDNKIVFIFDECHRSQFGDTHKRIIQYFTNYQMFGFTGTPIFADNAASSEGENKTTKDLFGNCLHKYVITDAIRDENVLKFSVEYYNTVSAKVEIEDTKVQNINTKEVLEAPQRLELITDYIINNHNDKSKNNGFTGMFCVSNVDVACKYYELFKAKKLDNKHKLKIATIFSYTANEESEDANGFIPDSDIEPNNNTPINRHSRDKLEEYIGDYNSLFGTKFTTKDSLSFYNYYNDIANKVKNKQIDVLIVVNMFLTGFDSPYLNTLYVDKNLKYHGLIQAFSRTNRILGETKSHGNIVSFRNIKSQTDEAITLFSNKEAIETVLIEPYETYVLSFQEAVENLHKITPTVDSVNALVDENAEYQFVKSFREILKIKNTLESFTDFDYNDIGMSYQEIADYTSKYLDLNRKVQAERSQEKVSILDDIDFGLEFLHKDNINVAYILTLLAKLKNSTPDDKQFVKNNIDNLLSSDVNLRSKRELIQRFIDERFIINTDTSLIEDEFDAFVETQKQNFIKQLCVELDLDIIKFQSLINDYIYHEREPINEEFVKTFNNDKIGLLERKPLILKIKSKLREYTETYIVGI